MHRPSEHAHPAPAGTAEGLPALSPLASAALPARPEHDSIRRIIEVRNSGARERTVWPNEAPMIDAFTRTDIRMGSQVKALLSQQEPFARDTIMIVPRNSSVSVQRDGESYVLSEPGAMLLKPGLDAEVSFAGSPLVIQSAEPPEWYRHYGHQVSPREVTRVVRKFNRSRNGDDKSTTPPDSTRRVCRKTDRTKFDHTGIDHAGGGIFSYLAAGKINLWSGKGSEWLVHSLTWRGRREPPYIGVSMVSAPEYLAKPIDFTLIRPAESPHFHPTLHTKHPMAMTEVYCMLKGHSALFMVVRGRPCLQYLKAGDVLVLKPDLVHGIVAASEDYEHAVLQLPSTFHYGLRFKREVPYEVFGLTKEQVLRSAIRGLNEGRDGMCALRG